MTRDRQLSQRMRRASRASLLLCFLLSEITSWLVIYLYILSEQTRTHSWRIINVWLADLKLEIIKILNLASGCAGDVRFGLGFLEFYFECNFVVVSTFGRFRFLINLYFRTVTTLKCLLLNSKDSRFKVKEIKFWHVSLCSKRNWENRHS